MSARSPYQPAELQAYASHGRVLSRLNMPAPLPPLLPRDGVVFGACGLLSPVSPARALHGDEFTAAVNPHLGPSALAVTLSPPLPLTDLGDPFDLCPNPSPAFSRPSTLAQGWPTGTNDGTNVVEIPAPLPHSRPAEPPLPRPALLPRSPTLQWGGAGRPVSPALVSSGLAAFQHGSLEIEGLRIFLDPSHFEPKIPPREPQLPPREVCLSQTTAGDAPFGCTPSPSPPSTHTPGWETGPPERSLHVVSNPSCGDPQVSAESTSNTDLRPPENVTTFIWKLFKLLDDDAYAPWIQWDESGRRILIALGHVRFLAILGLFFRHGSVKSFVRQLHIYGFRRAPASRTQPDLKRDLDSNPESGQPPNPETYTAFHHRDFARVGSTQQQRNMLALMRPGGHASHRPSDSFRTTRSRTMRSLS